MIASTRMRDVGWFSGHACERAPAVPSRRLSLIQRDVGVSDQFLRIATPLHTRVAYYPDPAVSLITAASPKLPRLEVAGTWHALGGRDRGR
jgi:hypothetical protein